MLRRCMAWVVTEALGESAGDNQPYGYHEFAVWVMARRLFCFR
jgi:hypothetical protein